MPFLPPRRTAGAELLICREGRDITVLSKTKLGEVELPPSYEAADSAIQPTGFHYQLVDRSTGKVEFTGIINDPTGVTVEIPVVNPQTNEFVPFRKTRDDLTRPHYFTLLVPDVPRSILRISSPDMTRAFRMDPDIPLEIPIEPPREPRRRKVPTRVPKQSAGESKGGKREQKK